MGSLSVFSYESGEKSALIIFWLLGVRPETPGIDQLVHIDFSISHDNFKLSDKKYYITDINKEQAFC